jgi:hypothetical protein
LISISVFSESAARAANGAAKKTAVIAAKTVTVFKKRDNSARGRGKGNCMEQNISLTRGDCKLNHELAHRAARG